MNATASDAWGEITTHDPDQVQAESLRIAQSAERVTARTYAIARASPYS